MGFTAAWKNIENVFMAYLHVRLLRGEGEEWRDAEIVYLDAFSRENSLFQNELVGARLSVVMPDKYRNFLEVVDRMCRRRERVTVFSFIDDETRKCYDVWLARTDEEGEVRIFLENQVREWFLRRLLKKTYGELREVRRTLAENEKKLEELLTLKSAFVVNVCHEIRTSLNAIFGFVDLLAQTDQQEERHLYANLMQENQENLIRLMNDMADIAKLDEGKLELCDEEVNLSHLFNQVVDGLKHRFPETWDLLVIDEVALTSPILLDGYRFMQIMDHLLRNRLRFAGSCPIHVGCRRHEEGILFYITTEQERQMIFDPSVELNAWGQGMGVELILCRLLIGRMGGKILSPHSSEEEGGVFRFLLPLKK